MLNLSTRAALAGSNTSESILGVAVSWCVGVRVDVCACRVGVGVGECEKDLAVGDGEWNMM